MLSCETMANVMFLRWVIVSFLLVSPGIEGIVARVVVVRPASIPVQPPWAACCSPFRNVGVSLLADGNHLDLCRYLVKSQTV